MANKKKKSNQQLQTQQLQQEEERQDRIELKGVVDEALPGTLFHVKTDLGSMVLATLGGKLRLNRIRILPGDEVLVEVSPYDMSRGRITWRARGQ